MAYMHTHRKAKSLGMWMKWWASFANKNDDRFANTEEWYIKVKIEQHVLNINFIGNRRKRLWWTNLPGILLF